FSSHRLSLCLQSAQYITAILLKTPSSVLFSKTLFECGNSFSFSTLTGKYLSDSFFLTIGTVSFRNKDFSCNSQYFCLCSSSLAKDTISGSSFFDLRRSNS